MLLISHDRDFLDRVVNGVIVPEGDGKWLEYAGGYSDMLTQRGDGSAPRADRQRRRESGGESRARRKPPRSKSKLSFKDKHALETLPKTDGRVARQDRQSCKANSTIRSSTRATANASTKPRRRSARRTTNSPPRKRSGWSWRFCARRSRG